MMAVLAHMLVNMQAYLLILIFYYIKRNNPIDTKCYFLLKLKMYSTINGLIIDSHMREVFVCLHVDIDNSINPCPKFVGEYDVS